jgi:NAD(P)-dependent dehydrogenase (short-subunit alcohol dehydrogenase family)
MFSVLPAATKKGPNRNPCIANMETAQMASLNGISGKRVLVTAGAAGIGRATAELFAEQGAEVLVCDIDQNALDDISKSALPISVEHADVANEADVDRLFEVVKQRLGGIDVLVNNAGISGPMCFLEDMSLKDWRRCVEVNLDGSFLCLRHALPMMKAQKSGCVVNISSSAGVLGYPKRTPYASAKWAIVGLTKSLAMEVGSFGVRVNAIAPGSVEGERMERVIEAEARAHGHSEDYIRQNYLRMNSMRTFVSGRDIAEAVVFLASDGAAKMSGQILSVDGHTETLAVPEC